MKIKINIPKDKDIVFSYMNTKNLTQREKIIKQRIEDILCLLVDVDKIEYGSPNGYSLVSLKKDNEYIYVEIDDDMIVDESAQ